MSWLLGGSPLWSVMVPSTPQRRPIIAPMSRVMMPRCVMRKPVWWRFQGQRENAAQARFTHRRVSQPLNHQAL